MLSSSSSNQAALDRFEDGTKKQNIFEQCQSELLTFVGRCVTMQAKSSGSETPTPSNSNSVSDPSALRQQKIVTGMTGILDESKYSFVEKIKSRIRSELSGLIEEQLQADTSTETMVPIIVDKILVSKKYLELVHQISQDAQICANDLLKQLPTPKSSESNHRATPNSHDQSFSGHSAGTIESCSLGSLASGICPKDDELQSIIDQLDPKKPVHVRTSAATLLGSFSVGDLLADEFWPVSKITMQLALSDTDFGIANIGMEIYARSFKLAPAYMIPEVYSSFTSQLITLLQKSPTLQQSNSTYSLSIQDQRVSHLLKMFRLLTQFMMQIPLYWFRFTEAVCKQVLEVTGTLLKTTQVQVPAALSLSALHFLAIVDPKALWYHKWMMSNVGKRLVVETFERCSLAPLFVKNFTEYAEKLHQEPKTPLKRGNGIEIEREDVEYLYFINLISILKKLVLCSSGRTLFPIVYINRARQESKLDIHGFILKLVQLVSCNATLSSDDGVTECPAAEFRVSKFCSAVVRELASADLVIQQYLLKDEYIKEFTGTLKKYLLDVDTGDNSLICVAETLSFISTTDSGRQLLIWGEGRNADSISETSAEFLETLMKLLEPRFVKTQKCRKATSPFLFLVRQLYRNYDGFHLLSSKNPASKILALKELAGDDEEWTTSIVDNLLNLAATPKGLLLLQSTGPEMLHICVDHMFRKKRKKVSKCERFGYGTLVSQIATSKHGMLALCKVGWISGIVHEINEILQTGTDDPGVDIDHQNVVKCVGNLEKVVTTFPGLSACLEYEERVKKEDGLEVLLKEYALCDMSMSPGFACVEESRQVGLRILKHCMSNLDSLIFLETRFHIVESLKSQLVDSFVDSTFVQDENSLFVNYLLVSAHIIGGPNERKLPALLPGTDDLSVFDKDARRDLFVVKEKKLKLFTFDSEYNTRREFEDGCSRCLVDDGVTADFPSFFANYKRHFDIQEVSLYEEALDGKLELEDEIASKSLNFAVNLTVNYAHHLLPHHSLLFLESSFRKVLAFAMNPKHDIIRAPTKTNSGFDWFLATLFILCDANPLLTCQFALELKNIEASEYMWPMLNKNIDSNASVAFCHSVEELVSTSLPLVSSAFTLSGCTISQIVQRWTRECFWTILDFPLIKTYILTTLMWGKKASVYYSTALLHQVGKSVVKASREERVLHYLNEPGVFAECKVSRIIQFIKDLM